ncbi:FAD-dependent oxidoreductase [Streptomyces sp. HUAS MG47]|uniref:NAD(P)/FAD-dependent oxidoreductase n=1 Tax=Streptomyces solicamelliae TaxID=3231716 RepID=UPI003877914D
MPEPHDAFGRPYVVVGAGVAGAAAALTLRAEGYTGDLVLIGEEPELPYRRPPLSKDVLTGAQAPARTLLRPAGTWAEQGIELRTGRAVTELRPAERTIVLDDGEELPYARLLLATGGRPRGLAGVAESPGPHRLRTLADARALRADLIEGGPLLVVGAGLIGLEVAAAARGLGCEVTVVESEPRPLGRVLPPAVADAVAALHRDHGVDLRTGVRLARLERHGDTWTATDHDGRAITARTVLAAVGMTPDTALAERAGLKVDDGIVVDLYGETSASGVYAAGDVARRPGGRDGGTCRVEHWTNAQDHGAAVARSMLGTPTPYAPEPWFWTHQFGHNLQVAGRPDAADDLEADGDLTAMDFTARTRHEGRVTGVICANRPAEFRRLRQESERT